MVEIKDDLEGKWEDYKILMSQFFNAFQEKYPYLKMYKKGHFDHKRVIYTGGRWFRKKQMTIVVRPPTRYGALYVIVHLWKQVEMGVLEGIKELTVKYTLKGPEFLRKYPQIQSQGGKE